MRINAVFEGGGVKGIALAGAVTAAERRGVQFQRVAGTSSGSIVAALIAAGYSGEEMKELILNTPFSSFLKRSRLFEWRIGGSVLRLLIKKGLYSGEALEDWIRGVLLARGVRTFADLKPKQLRIIASDITNGKLLVLPDDLAQYGLDPNAFSVAKAIRMSTSIPFFFDPVMLRKNKPAFTGEPFSDQFVYIVDGGVLSNFPLWLFDRDDVKDQDKDLPAIGFQLVGRSDFEPRRIRGPFSMMQALFTTMLSAHDERFIEDHARFRTIKIPTLGVPTTNFNLSKETSMALYDSGIRAADKFFGRWSLSAYQSQLTKFVFPIEAIPVVKDFTDQDQ